MGAVLNQDEVDALLRGVSGDDMDMDDEEDEYDPEEVVPFDLTAQDRIIRGRMPTLEIIHDRFVRLFRLTLSNALRKVVDISVRSTELIKFGEFLKTHEEISGCERYLHHCPATLEPRSLNVK